MSKNNKIYSTNKSNTSAIKAREAAWQKIYNRINAEEPVIKTI